MEMIFTLHACLQGDKDEEAVTEVTMYNLLAILIVVVAIAYIIRTFCKKLKKQDTGCCECSTCNTDSTYCEPTKD